MENTCIVKVKNGKHFVYLPDGTEIPGVVKTVVVDDPSSTRCILTINVILE